MQVRDFLKAQNIRDTREVVAELEKGRDLSLFGLGFSGKLHLAGYLPGFTFYVAPDVSVAGKVRDGLTRAGIKAEIFPEEGDVLIYSKTYSKERTYQRLAVLGKMLDDELDVVITTPAALINYVPDPERFLRASVFVQKTEMDVYQLSEKLVAAGYKRVDRVEKKGEFSVRGDIFDLFPINEFTPVRLEFFGDEITDIRRFDVETMRGISSLDSVTVYPATEMLCSTQKMAQVPSKINLSLKNLEASSAVRKQEITEEVITRVQGGDTDVPWLTPYIREELATVFSYVKSGTVLFDECKQINDTVGRLYEEHYSRVKTLLRGGEVTTEHAFAVVPKEQVYKTDVPRVAFQQITTQNPIFAPQAVISFRSASFSKYYMERALLYSDVATWNRNGYRVVLFAGDATVAENLYFELLGRDVAPSKRLSENRPITVVEEYFPSGVIFHKEKLVLIGTNDLVRPRAQVARSKKRNVFTSFAAGDYAVHDVHGIGLVHGITKLKVEEGEKDYVEVGYLDGKLYVPVEQINLLQRYSGSDKTPALSKLGGKEFAKLKARVKASIGEMAVDLVELYKEREKLVGFKYLPDTELTKEFDEAFPYTETEDQLAAIRDVKRDMERGRLMDRLLCGDVGYGKTEVALRAVFKAIESGKQAAILAPTTILSQQHFNTAKLRFQDFPVQVEVINRFRKPKEVKEILKRLESGDIDVICGTHRLLSKDVKFKDLGLLVLDEEQRFGVADKEKIKDMKRDVGVLTMSATPIPRTLHMSLSGIRDISILETPPENRLPVQTFVTEFSEGLVADCINRELSRGGQCFVLYNKVESIDSFAARVADIVPGARITVCHGQMEESILESRIAEFYNGESDVLVSTTIIENGIDLPNANTLIVCDADMLGLSQLYQLRGRVGRGERLAYAYFTYREDKVLTEQAYKRLTAIMDYTELGSGFKIAMRDLEIRGAGNVLGREQHGHMEKVGYDMYCKLLAEVIGELDGKKTVERTETEMKIELASGIPEDYVSGEDRIKLYREIAGVESKEDVDRLTASIKEMCGTVPDETVNLMLVSYMRNMAVKLGAATVLCAKRGAGIKFASSDAFMNRAVLYATSCAQGEMIISESQNAVVIRKNDKSIRAKFEILKEFLENATGYTEA